MTPSLAILLGSLTELPYAPVERSPVAAHPLETLYAPSNLSQIRSGELASNAAGKLGGKFNVEVWIPPLTLQPKALEEQCTCYCLS